MKLRKDGGFSYLKQLICVVVAVLTCLGIWHWWSSNIYVCYALTLGAVLFLIWCFYRIVFKGGCQEMAVYILSGVSVIMFANKMYDYEKLRTLFPMLKKVDPIYFVLAFLGGILITFILVKVSMYIYSNFENNKTVYNTENETDVVKTSGTAQTSTTGTDNKNNNKTGTIVYLLLLIFLAGAGCALFGILYKNGIPLRDYDFFEVVISLLKYAGSVVLILLAFVVVIIFLIEMLRLIIARMRVFFVSLKEESKEDSVPLYALSAVIAIVVFYLAYMVTGITIDTFYDFVNKSEYLALPLLILFIGTAFVVFLRLIHATLLLLVGMKTENIKEFWKKLNDKINITERVAEILRMIMDIILNSVIVVLKFVIFIPDFFDSVYSFVLEDEDEFELEDEINDESGKDGKNNN